MEALRKNLYRLLGISLVAVFLLSAVLYGFSSQRKDHRVFFFSRRSDALHLGGEIRHLPDGKNRENEIKLFVNELCLGPVDVGYRRILPRGTKVNRLHLDDNRLYVDFNEEFLFSYDDVSLGYDEVLAAVERNILFNFRFVEEIVFTVNGQEPFSPYFEL